MRNSQGTRRFVQWFHKVGPVGCIPTRTRNHRGFEGKGVHRKTCTVLMGCLKGSAARPGPSGFSCGQSLRRPPPTGSGPRRGGFSCGSHPGAPSSRTRRWHWRLLLRLAPPVPPRNGPDRASHRVYWSKMRLGSAVLRRLCGGLVQNASEFDRFGAIRAKSGRLRRILEQAPVAPPFPPETQTHFGTPDGARPPGRGRRASSAQ